MEKRGSSVKKREKAKLATHSHKNCNTAHFIAELFEVSISLAILFWFVIVDGSMSLGPLSFGFLSSHEAGIYIKTRDRTANSTIKRLKESIIPVASGYR
jgi:hypothetical protein